MLGEDRSARTGSTDPRARAKSPLGRLVNWITGNKEGEDPHAEPEPDVAVPARASSSAQGQIEAHAKIESVIAAFTATREDEIELSIGDKVAIAQIHDDGFAHGTNQRTGKFGAFPYSAVSHSAASEPHSIGERVSSLLGAVTGTVTNAASAVGSTVTSFFHHSEAGPAHQAGSGLAATQVAIGEYVKAGPNDLRSPCPALNSLANHGHLPRNGRLITADMLVNAVKEVYNIDPSQLISSVFPLRAAASSGVRTADQVNELGVEYINLNDLGLHSHSSIEHDVSLTRNDAYFGDNSAVVPEFVEAMIAESTDGDYVSREDMTRHRLKRFNDSKARNPELSYNVKQATTASFEAAVALNVLGRDDKIPLEHVRSFFLEERIPDNYQKPVVEASIFLTEVKTAQLLTEWGYALTFNKTQKPEEALPVDTRTFSLRQIQTNEIEKHMIPANASNVPKQVPAKWHGIFYTDGNPSADQCCSIANGTWHEDKNAYYIPVYGPGIWGWDDSLAGRALFEATRATSLNYKIQFDSHTGIASFHPVYAFGSAHHFLQVEIPGTFIAIPTDNPNIFIRRTNIFGGDGYAEYRLVRIVDGEGRRTPEYESIYLSRLNRDQEETVEGTVKSGKTHLRSTQMIAVVDQGDVNVAAYSVQIVTGEEFRGLSGAQIEVTVHHSESDVTDAEIKSTGPITLSTSPKTFYDESAIPHRSVNEYEASELSKDNIKHVHAISVTFKTDGLFAGKEWKIDGIHLKRPQGAQGAATWYFPAFTWMTDGATRSFFNGAETGISSRAPKPIQALQAKELAWAREVYKPEFDVEGLPIGMTDNYDHLTTEEKSHNRVYLAFREFQKFGVVESMMVLRKEFTSFGEIDILYGMDIRPFDKPAIAHTWKKDAVYGRQFVAGTNPIMLQAVSTTTAFPPPALKSFSIDSISLVPVLAGKDVKHLISQGRFTFVDYRPYLAPFVTEYKASEKKKNGGTIVAPVGLFYHDVEGAEVYPIGIQLEDGGYIFHPSTTLEPEKDCAWLTAKMWLALADTQVHELSTHLFKVHLCVEPFGIALHRQLPRSHPVFKLVTPHMDGTMQINAEGREIFIPVLAQIFSMGDGIIDFFKHVHSNLDFFELGPVKDLEKRGFGADSTSSLNMPGQYPWAEDARDLWEILTNYCDSFLALHYANDAAIAADTELQAWIKECATFFRYKGVPTSLSSRSQLTQVVATIIWTGSAQHSSVNYPQYEYYGFPPNRPPKTYLPVPKQRDDSLEERKAVAFLPPAVESLIAINTAATLAQYNEYDNYLGDRKFDYFGPAARQELGVMTQFSQDLVAYDGRIKARNETLPGRKENPYKWLLTTQIVASTRV